MHVVVFGANGNIGHRVVRRLLEKDHTVTAFVHKNASLADNPNLLIVSGDVTNSDDVTNAIEGTDAVISTLGSWGTKSQDILTSGMKRIIPAMKHHNVSRIISLTGSGVILSNDNVKWYDHLNPLLLRIVAPKILIDGKQHIELLAATNLTWTVVRSPVMKNAKNEFYSLSTTPPAPWKRASRESVAAAMVDQLSDTAFIRQTPFIA